MGNAACTACTGNSTFAEGSDEIADCKCIAVFSGDASTAGGKCTPSYPEFVPQCCAAVDLLGREVERLKKQGEHLESEVEDLKQQGEQCGSEVERLKKQGEQLGSEFERRLVPRSYQPATALCQHGVTLVTLAVSCRSRGLNSTRGTKSVKLYLGLEV